MGALFKDEVGPFKEAISFMGGEEEGNVLRQMGDCDRTSLNGFACRSVGWIVMCHDFAKSHKAMPCHKNDTKEQCIIIGRGM